MIRGEVTSRVKLRKQLSKEDVIKFLNATEINQVNKKLINDFLEFKSTEVSKGIKTVLSFETLKWYVSYLRIIEKIINGKPHTELNREDCKNIMNFLVNDKELTPRGKCNCVKAHKTLLRWLWNEGLNKVIKIKGRNATFDQVFYDYGWRMQEDEKEPLIIDNEQALNIHDWLMSKEKEYFKNKAYYTAYKYLMAALFLRLGWDFGGRPEELFNIRKEHLVWDEEHEKYWVYCQYHKKNSQKRNVDIPYCTDILKEYHERINIYTPLLNLESNILFNVKLKAAIPNIVKKAMKELNIKGKFTLYTLRHSSIQHYTELYKGNIIALAARYGWSLAKAPERLKDYLARSKIGKPDAQSLRRTDEIQRLNQKYEEDIAYLTDQVSQLKEAFNLLTSDELKKIKNMGVQKETLPIKTKEE